MTASSSVQTRDRLQIGGVVLNRLEAFKAAELYFSDTGSFAYPAYDAYDGGAGPWRISDGDLLAPVVLNVRTSITAFYSLVRIRPRLRVWLEMVPADARLAEATDAELKLLGELYAVLDEGVPGVGGATLAKIMHRKRPSFVPLFDRYIWWASRCGMSGRRWVAARRVRASVGDHIAHGRKKALPASAERPIFSAVNLPQVL